LSLDLEEPKEERGAPMSSRKRKTEGGSVQLRSSKGKNALERLDAITTKVAGGQLGFNAA